MRQLYLSLIFLFSTLLPAQSQFQQFINYVNSLGDPTEKQAVVDSFMTYARTVGIPFIEDSTANFIYLGNPNSVTVPGDFNGWSITAWPMTHLSQTNFWYRSENFELDARLDYKFVLNGSTWILDPENPNTCQGGFGPNSELSMPLYLQPWEINYNPNIAHGTVVPKTLYSTNVGTNYHLNIYLPPGYDSLGLQTYPTVYFQDGSEYISLGKATNVIDNLLDSSKIQPVIAVFVTPNNRNEEYAGTIRNQYRLFFVEELVPYIDANYKTEIDPEKRLVLGDSYGGNISALISYNHPDVFGLCGLHSGALQPNGYEAYNLIINGPVEDIKWSSIWGSYEGSLTQNMRSLKDYLLNANYELDWLERPEGHSWGLWRASIDMMLEYFFPDNSSGIIAENNFVPDNIILYQNYPNPFNPSTNIRFEVPHSTHIKLVLYDLLGREIKILFEGGALAGMNEIELNAENLAGGIYFYRLISEDFIATKKLILLK
ncbi:MAG: alpha/beta hydrolase-fold protein [Ignavibacteriaceae bacterium]|nr:alpha/beta hydrolase-fold protein [Ignavibacteriaceae bacterium]MCW9095433.1 alpha/beta hydrolase-fold protein [Ignavibacteriaceae bacterium]MCW9097672.1 alpha/beta hydrolase-fold protein [Ignavibacteriaceae bacterium]